MNSKEFTKFFSGFAVNQVLTHGAFAAGGVEFILFGMTYTPGAERDCSYRIGDHSGTVSLLLIVEEAIVSFVNGWKVSILKKAASTARARLSH